MLKFLRKRKNQKRIFIALAIIIIPAFVYWGSSSTTRTQKGKKYAGEIFNRRVSFEDYADTFAAVKNKLLLRFGSQIYMVKDLDLNALTWEHLILLEEAKRLHIKVTDQELTDFIRSVDAFKKDGQFNQDIYEDALKYTFRSTPREFEEQIRQDLMLNLLMQKVMSDSLVTVSDAEIKEAYMKEDKKFNAKKFAAEKAKWQEFLMQKKKLEALQKYLEDLKAKSHFKDYIPKD